MNQNMTYAALYGRYDSGGKFVAPGEGISQTDGAPPDLLTIIHPFWSQFPPGNPMIMGLLSFLYTVLWIINAFGNCAVISVFTKTKTLRTPANLLVVNLAIADFCMMMSQGPFFVINTFYSRWWYWGNFACEMYAFLGSVFGIAAIFTMAGIGYDRYMVITNSIGGPRLTNGKALIIILFIWAYSIGISIPPLLKVWGGFGPEGLLTTCSFDYLTETYENKTYCLFLFIMAYVVPLLILIFTYSKIVGAVFSHEKTLREQAKKMNVDSLRTMSADQKETSAEMKIAKASMTCVFLWVAIWTPYAAITMVGAFGNRALLTPIISQLPAVAAKCASCFNPIVFAISHPRFQAALRKFYPWLYCGNPGPSDGQSDAQSNATTIKS